MKFFKKGYSPTIEERGMFEGVTVLGDGIMSSDDCVQWDLAVDYFTDKGALATKFKNKEHERLQDDYDFYRSLILHARAEGRSSDGVLDRLDKVVEEMEKKGYDIF